jgi:2,3-bisphosphoglycerate-dependent phosphoglycerate mutase
MAARVALSAGINSWSPRTTAGQGRSVSLTSTVTRSSFVFPKGGNHDFLQVGVVRSKERTLRSMYSISASSTDGSDTSSSKGRIFPEGALILIRHGESLWNQKNLFTGCVDVPLSQQGVKEALEAGKRIRDIPVDMIFTSDLIRAQMTAMLAMTQHRKQKVPTVLHNESDRAIVWSTIFSEDTQEETIPVVIAWELNERMYGELQGLNKQETADKYGADQVKVWRRSYDVPPPNGESLAMCAERAVAYFKEYVEPQLNSGKNVLISAHGNSLRSIIMYLDKLTSQEVIELELSTGIPMLYGFKEGKFIRRGSPVGQDAYGVYALTHDLAAYRAELDKVL